MAHPSSIGVAVAALLLGIVSALTASSAPIDLSPAGEALPMWQLLIIATCLGVGGATTLAALLIHWGTIERAQLVHRIGLILQTGGWWARAVVICFAPGPSWGSSAIVSLVLGLACLVGLFASLASARRIRLDVARWRWISEHTG